MKFRNVLITLGLAVASFGGMALAMNAHSETKATFASGETYYYAGTDTTKNNYSTAWSDWSENTITEGGESVAYTFVADEEFKFKTAGEGGWGTAIGVGNLRGTALGYFNNNLNNDNITCKVAGTYDVSIKDGKVYIDLQNPNYATIYVQVQGWSKTTVYAFDESVGSVALQTLGAWPGIAVSELTDGVNFHGDLGGIGKIVVPYVGNKANTKIILSDNGNDESSSAYLNPNYYYYKTGTPRENLGKQAAVIFNIAQAISDAGSACDIAPATATTLVAAYDALEDTNKSGVDSTTLWTWADKTKTSSADFTFDKIVAQLRTISSGSGTRTIGIVPNGNTNVAIVIIVISVITLTSVVAFVFIRKRKAQK